MQSIRLDNRKYIEAIAERKAGSREVRDGWPSYKQGHGPSNHLMYIRLVSLVGPFFLITIPTCPS